ncbi:hypothetical protein X737_38015 [Mesorhizobium sp. L48C026A00]|nr:hypothetical protein X737_38015 [Mesorhizobium sp. L48C026A00]
MRYPAAIVTAQCAIAAVMRRMPPAGTDGWVKARERPGGLAGCGGQSELHRHRSCRMMASRAASIGEEAIVADAVEAVGQRVQEEDPMTRKG